MARNAFKVMIVAAALLVAGHAQAQAAFDVRDFGARGDGRHDDTQAFRQAIDKAMASGKPATVTIPAGRYRLASPRTLKGTWGLSSGKGAQDAHYRLDAHLIIDHADHLTLAGQGNATLLMGDPSVTGLEIVASTHVTLRDLAIDYDPLPFTQGKVVAVNRVMGTFDVRLDSGFPEPAGPSFQGRDAIWRAVFLDPGTRQFDFRVPDYRLTRAEKVDDRTWRMHVRARQRLKALEHFQAGGLVVIMGRHNGSPALQLFRTSDSLLKNVDVYTAPGGAFNLKSTDGISLDTCSVAPPKGSDRLLSTNADGAHVKHNRKGPTIIASRFTRQGDDAINIGTGLFPVLVQKSPDTVLLDLPPNAHVGDELQFLDSRSGEQVGTSTIRQLDLVRWGPRQVFTVKLATPVHVAQTQDAMGLGQRRAGPPIKRSMLDRRLPTLAVDTALAGDGAVIRGNTFIDHRARGVLIKGAHALIEGNTFEHLAGPAIFAGFELNFIEGPSVHDLTIRKNTFKDVALTNILVANAGLGPWRLLPDGYGNRGITISDNTFTAMGAPSWRSMRDAGKAITVSNAEDVHVQDNVFPTAAGDDGQALIKLDRVRRAAVRAKPGGASKGTPRGHMVELAPDADRGSISVEQ